MIFRYESFHEIETISEDQIESIRYPIFEGVKYSKNCPVSILCAKTASMHCTQSLVLHITYVHKKKPKLCIFSSLLLSSTKYFKFFVRLFFFIAKKPRTILIIFHARAYYTIYLIMGKNLLLKIDLFQLCYNFRELKYIKLK